MAADTTIDDVALYVKPHPDSGVYRYYRRVPAEAAAFDRRAFIKQSLKTKSLAEAQRRAIPVHDACVALWQNLIAGAGALSSWQKYETAVKLATSLGFTYRSAAEIANESADDILSRIEKVQEHTGAPQVEDALLGTVPEPDNRLSGLLELYVEHNVDGLAGLSPNQFKKHKTSRMRAIGYLIGVIGDKKITEITRRDALRFKLWWRDKVMAEGLTAYAANRSFSDIRGMLKPIDIALETDCVAVWAGISVAETNATALAKRPPLPPSWVRDRILAEGALDGLPLQARCIVYIFAETGMRPGGEIANLRGAIDIKLEGDEIDGVPFVPHVQVVERTDRRQKSKNAVRRIPLVGVALWAARQCPDGFPDYADKGDVLSDEIGHYLRTNGLLPTEEHVFYSLRHTFQDRIENAGCSERMQADLMGHEFGRPVYGDGPELVRRQALLKAIAFPVPWAI